MISNKHIEKSIEPNIIELLSKLRRQTNQNKQNQPENEINEKENKSILDEDENILSTQNMIN